MIYTEIRKFCAGCNFANISFGDFAAKQSDLSGFLYSLWGSYE